MAYLKIKDGAQTKAYELYPSAPKPYITVKNVGVLPVTTSTTNGMQLKVKINGSNCRPMQTTSTSESNTYTTTSLSPGGMSSTTERTANTQINTTTNTTTNTNYVTTVRYASDLTTLDPTYYYTTDNKYSLREGWIDTIWSFTRKSPGRYPVAIVRTDKTRYLTSILATNIVTNIANDGTNVTASYTIYGSECDGLNYIVYTRSSSTAASKSSQLTSTYQNIMTSYIQNMTITRTAFSSPADVSSSVAVASKSYASLFRITALAVNSSMDKFTSNGETCDLRTLVFDKYLNTTSNLYHYWATCNTTIITNTNTTSNSTTVTGYDGVSSSSNSTTIWV